MSEIEVRQVSVQHDVVQAVVEQVSIEENAPAKIILQDVGSQGPQGPQGIQGIQGVKGDKGDPGGFTNSTNLLTENLNTVTTPGLYYAQYSADWAARNIPIGDSGHVQVMRNGGAIHQRWAQTTNGVYAYLRTSTSGGTTWGNWVMEGNQAVNTHTGQSDPHSLYAKKAGDTFTGTLNVSRASSVMQAMARSDAPADKRRWQVSVDAVGNLAFAGTNDAASAVDTALFLNRNGSIDLNGTLHLRGNGFPESVVTAPVGSRYVDAAGTNGAVEWVKMSGTGNTGWKVANGDTGRRNISSLLTNGWTGTVYLRRVNDLVYLDLEPLTPTTATSTSVLSVPAGFRPSPQARIMLNTISPVPIFRRADWNEGSNSFNVSNYATSDGSYYCQIQIPAHSLNQKWPSALPGVAG